MGKQASQQGSRTRWWWSPDQNLLMYLLFKFGKTNEEVQQIMGMTRTQVQNRIKKYNLRENVGRAWANQHAKGIAAPKGDKPVERRVDVHADRGTGQRAPLDGQGLAG